MADENAEIKNAEASAAEGVTEGTTDEPISEAEVDAAEKIINDAVAEHEANVAAAAAERPKIDHQLLEEVLDAIRPSFQADGGDIELIGVDDATGVVTVEMTGACAGCMFASSDVTQGIDTIICEHVPGVTAVRPVMY